MLLFFFLMNFHIFILLNVFYINTLLFRKTPWDILLLGKMSLIKREYIVCVYMYIENIR